MSLDVTLTVSEKVARPERRTIFIREGGQNKKISMEEWEKRFPGRKPVQLKVEAEETNEVYSANITHNLGEMANKAGLYEALWRPEEINCTHAGEIIEILEMGLQDLKDFPEFFKKFDAENGWGVYEDFVPFVEDYLAACKQYPHALIRVSR